MWRPRRVLEDQLRPAFQTLCRSFRLEALVTGVPAVEFLLPLLAGELHLVGVDDDDEVAGVDMRGVGGAMLAHEDHGDLARQPPDPLVGRVDQPPALLDFTLLRHERLH
jgi:hypothetical protein